MRRNLSSQLKAQSFPPINNATSIVGTCAGMIDGQLVLKDCFLAK